MPTVITGTDGINQVQTGAVESGDLPAGSVVQVVSPNLSSISNTRTTSTSFVATNALATITPSNANNKIFVIISTNLQTDNGEEGVEAAIYRNSARITSSANRPSDGALLYDGTAASQHWVFNTCVLDAPNSVSSITYRLYTASYRGGNVRHRADWGLTTFTLMEIAG